MEPANRSFDDSPPPEAAQGSAVCRHRDCIRVRRRFPIPSHRCNPFRTDVGCQYDVGIEAGSNEFVLNRLVIWAVPQVLMLPRVYLQIVQLPEIMVVIHRQLVAVISVHRRVGSGAASKVGVEGIEVLAADELAVHVGVCSTGQQRDECLSLHALWLFQASQFDERCR